MLTTFRSIVPFLGLVVFSTAATAQFSGLGSFAPRVQLPDRQSTLKAMLDKLNNLEKEAVFSLMRENEELQQIVLAQQQRLKALDAELIHYKTSKP